MTRGQRIKYLRNREGLTLEAVGKHLGIQKSGVKKYENDTIKTIPTEHVEIMAELFNVSPSYIMGWTNDQKGNFDYHSAGLRDIKVKRLPMLGNVACGEPIFADEHVEAYISVDADTEADFCLIAKGDSMINARIFDGDTLFVKRQDDVDEGEIAVILIEDEATVKRLYRDMENGITTLMPENPMYKPMRYTGPEQANIRILGKVILGQYKCK